MSRYTIYIYTGVVMSLYMIVAYAGLAGVAGVIAAAFAFIGGSVLYDAYLEEEKHRKDDLHDLIEAAIAAMYDEDIVDITENARKLADQTRIIYRDE